MPTVLIVDDEPNIRWTMEEFLRGAGYEALTAADYEAALSALDAAHALDAAVVDVVLPRRGGVELVQEMGRRAPEVPVIVMTGEPNVARLPEIVRAGAYDFLLKPVTKEVLLKAVARAVEKKRLDDEKRRLEEEVARHAEELERRIAERTAELSEARDFLDAVLDSATGYAIIAFDARTRVTLFNRGAELLFGYEAGQIIGEPFARLLDGWTAPAPYESTDREAVVLPPSASHVDESKAVGRRADGSVFTALLVVTPLRRAPASVEDSQGRLAIIKDLSVEEKQAVELAVMRARLSHQEKAAALGQMAAQVAHEVKNPLAGLRLYALHLRAKVADKLPPDDLALIDKIAGGVDHLNNLTERILDFARPLRLSPRSVNVVRVVQEALGLLGPHAAAAGVSVAQNFGAREIDAVVDETALSSALFNLALNSVQAMTKGGTLTVSAREAGGALRVGVEDTGPGMSAEQVEKAFEPFYTTKAKGLGLGLPYAGKVIEEHGGSISVESRVGVGTRISIRIPAGGETQ